MNQPGIYCILHVLSGTRYIGQTISLDRRWQQHQEALANGSHHNPRLQKAWSADGADAFEFKRLEVAPAYLNGLPLQEWLAEREADYIDTHKATRQAFNIVDAELVETAASRHMPEPENPNKEIQAGIAQLRPKIAEAEAIVRQRERDARNLEAEAKRLRSAATPKLMGFLKLVSAAEQQREITARALAGAAGLQLADAQTALAQAQAILNGLLEQRRALYQSYPGNQRRAITRKRFR